MCINDVDKHSSNRMKNLQRKSHGFYIITSASVFTEFSGKHIDISRSICRMPDVYLNSVITSQKLGKDRHTIYVSICFHQIVSKIY